MQEMITDDRRVKENTIAHRRRSLRALAAFLTGALLLASISPAQAWTCQNRDFALRIWDDKGTLTPSDDYYTWVSTEFGFTGTPHRMLRARTIWNPPPSRGPWETYRMVCLGGSTVAFRSIYNDLYVTTEMNLPGTDYGMLRARGPAISTWERYTITDVGSGFVSIKSLANNRYVSAEFGLGFDNPKRGMLRAFRTAASTWEHFIIYWL